MKGHKSKTIIFNFGIYYLPMLALILILIVFMWCPFSFLACYYPTYSFHFVHATIPKKNYMYTSYDDTTLFLRVLILYGCFLSSSIWSRKMFVFICFSFRTRIRTKKFVQHCVCMNCSMNFILYERRSSVLRLIWRVSVYKSHLIRVCSKLL